ncbi:MAG: carboxypeptidase regulatory-like domain-containing protein [Gemmatimonadales bacterium]
MRVRLIALFVLAAVPGSPRPARAQNPAAAVLYGVIKDVDGKPLPGVFVDISGAKRHAVTDDAGRFRLDQLTTDSLIMIVRRVGLVPLTFDVNLVPGRNDVTITMEQVPQVLDAIRNTVEQSGLFGVVGDTAFDIVEGATVSTVVHKATTNTNEKGQFFFDPVQPGADMVDVRKVGYRPRIVSFTMPVKGGQRVAIWLTPLPSILDERTMRRLSTPSNALVQELFDFGQRRRWASSARSMFATREQLAQYASGMRADDALRYLPRFGTVRPFEIDCVIVDGTMASGFFDQYYTNEMETLEITAVGQLSPTERGKCTPNGNTTGVRGRQHWAALIMLRH